MEERPQKRDLIFRSSSIDTSTPRLQPDQRRQPSFSSPTYSPAISPSYSDHSTSRGFYSPRGGEDEDEFDEGEESDGVDCNDVDEDERGYLYRPRSPAAAAVEMPVISTVSRSVRVEPKVETRVDSGVKEREYVERRVVEEDGGFTELEFSGAGSRRGSLRRKWEGRNTVVYDSGFKDKEVVSGMRVVEDESSVEFGGRKVFEFGGKEKGVYEEVSVELGGIRGRKLNAYVSDSGLKEEEVVIERLADRRAHKANAFVSDDGVKEKEGVVFKRLSDRRAHKANAVVSFVSDDGVKEEGVVLKRLSDRRAWNVNAFESDSGVKKKDNSGVVDEGNVEFRDGRVQKPNVFVSDSSVKEEVARGQSLLKEGNAGFRHDRGVGVKLEARNAMVLDSSPQLVYDSKRREEVEGTKTVMSETERKEEEEFVGANVMEEGIGRGGGGEGVEGVKASHRRSREGRKSEVLFMKKAGFCLRILSLVMCVISLSIMATNKNNGWALDSFDRYQEFRYCMAVSILGFVYSLAQAFDVAYHLSTDKYSIQHSQLRHYLDFFMDQALSYLLISASSSAATRVEDWVSNWGKDKFPQMASASVIMSFLAFGSFAFSSLVSGYTLCSVCVTSFT